MNIRNKTWVLDSHPPLLLPKFQVPRKAVFYHHQGNKKPLNPSKQMRQKPTEPTSPSQLPALLSSALSDSPREKVTSPPPHQPQCSGMPLPACTSRGTRLHFTLLTLNEMRAEIQPHWEILGFHFLWPLMIWISIWGQIQTSLLDNRYIFSNYFFMHKENCYFYWLLQQALINVLSRNCSFIGQKKYCEWL